MIFCVFFIEHSAHSESESEPDSESLSTNQTTTYPFESFYFSSPVLNIAITVSRPTTYTPPDYQLDSIYQSSGSKLSYDLSDRPVLVHDFYIEYRPNLFYKLLSGPLTQLLGLKHFGSKPFLIKSNNVSIGRTSKNILRNPILRTDDPFQRGPIFFVVDPNLQLPFDSIVIENGAIRFESDFSQFNGFLPKPKPINIPLYRFALINPYKLSQSNVFRIASDQENVANRDVNLSIELVNNEKGYQVLNISLSRAHKKPVMQTQGKNGAHNFLNDHEDRSTSILTQKHLKSITHTKSVFQIILENQSINPPIQTEIVIDVSDFDVRVLIDGHRMRTTYLFAKDARKYLNFARGNSGSSIEATLNRASPINSTPIDSSLFTFSPSANRDPLAAEKSPELLKKDQQAKLYLEGMIRSLTSNDANEANEANEVNDANGFLVYRDPFSKSNNFHWLVDFVNFLNSLNDVLLFSLDTPRNFSFLENSWRSYLQKKYPRASNADISNSPEYFFGRRYLYQFSTVLEKEDLKNILSYLVRLHSRYPPSYDDKRHTNNIIPLSCRSML